ncbi:MAG: undecaprenyldiphospho-muramoylpentapeptide beta-N-acetylglucosaminyltransferase [Elusimicrobiales bacterium]|nr:undecaprenyldiphospho-muramoylpentapeptide beta-N-acetylglucosaminyltransferase [Elusimicrobiales bacterium]
MDKRILMASGGTGGHFYPGFAIAQELRKRNWQVVFLVKKNDPALPIIENNNFTACRLDIKSLPRSFNPFKHLSFCAKLLKSIIQTGKIIKDFKPLLTVGMGSYVSFPATLACKFSHIPVIIHESNAKFGIANYLSGYFAKKTLLGLNIKKNPFKEKSVLSGTPVREFFSQTIPQNTAKKNLNLKENLPVFLAFGGSQGAKKINLSIVRLIKSLENKLDKFQIAHITGKRDFKSITEEYKKQNLIEQPNIKIFDYRSDMDVLYAAADIVVSRAGASTIAELMLLKKPAFLIPLPNSAADHQVKNAKILADNDCAVLIEENNSFEKILRQNFKKIIEDSSIIKKMRDNYEKLNMPSITSAASFIADIIETTVQDQG